MHSWIIGLGTPNRLRASLEMKSPWTDFPSTRQSSQKEGVMDGLGGLPFCGSSTGC
jgi:hypothetical protein